MAVTTKKTFNAVGAGGQSSTVFTPIGIELNNQDDLDVYVTLSGGTRVLNYRQSTSSTTDNNHPQVNDTTGLYFPAQNTGVSLTNYTISADNNTITFNGPLASGAVVSVERRTRDSSSSYTSFSGGSTIRSTDLNRAFDESNFTAQEARNKAFDIENRLDGSNIDGKTISTGSLTSSSVEVPTSSAVTTYVLNQLESIGGFIAIANEVSFPITNPDTNDDAGTVVAISDAGGVVVNSSGISTTGRTTGGAIVTITDFPAALRSLTLDAGMGLLVKTTGTLNTYNYHKAVANEADIVSIGSTVNSFNQRYRIGADDPTSNNDDGDLFYNTTSKIFKVYDSTGSGSWVKTTPTDAQLNQIGIVAAELGWSDDLGFITEALTTASSGDINTVADNITSVNRYANEYKIASSAPSSPSEGHLWYDTTNNVIKFYSGSAWVEAFSSADIVDEDDMTSNSATKVPSQQSVKAYVDEVKWLDQSAKVDGSVIYYNNSAGKFKADTTTTTSTIVDGGSF